MVLKVFYVYLSIFQTLNKEQGIHWIKEERLPAFLESDLYLEYRLAKLISQSKIKGERGEYALLQIDYKPRMKQKKKKEEDNSPKIDPKIQLMNHMFVSMGDTTATESNNWFSMATLMTDTDTTFSSYTGQESINRAKRPNSARPASAFSSMDKQYRSESGMGVSIRSSVYSSVGMRSNYTSKQSMYEEDVYSSKLFATNGKPMTPRPSENVCAIANDQSSSMPRPFSATVYSSPTMECDTENDDESGLGVEGDTQFDTDLLHDDFINIEEHGESDDEDGYVFENIDDLGAAIVGAILKKSVSVLANISEAEVLQNSMFAKYIPSSIHPQLTVEMLDRVSLVENVSSVNPESQDDEIKKVTGTEEGENKPNDEESETDSLLDSEEDYEEEDICFRTKKHKTFKLTDIKGIDAFKKFLKGTAGEKNWEMWIDIDRIQFLKKRAGTLGQEQVEQ